MRHRIAHRKLNITSSHRKALLKNMANSLIMGEQVQTTLPKAKELRPYVEKLITIGKQKTLQARRRLISQQQDHAVAEKLLTVLSTRYEKRAGGYTRVLRTGFRYGDNAPMAVIELLDRPLLLKPEAPKISEI